MATDKKDSKLSGADDEYLLFQQAMAGVRPLRGSKVVPLERGAIPTAKKVTPTPPSGLYWEDRQGRVDGRAAGVAEATLRDLRKGRLAPEATCNLHGYREDPCRHRVQSFLDESQANLRHIVLFVCGRGLHSGPQGPVLRGAILDVLKREMQKGRVLAVASAPPALGGEGALLVMLRRKRTR